MPRSYRMGDTGRVPAEGRRTAISTWTAPWARCSACGRRCRRTPSPPATLGTERAGSGVLIRKDGLVLTIGYLITEAETIWLTSLGGGAVPGHVLGYDQETGFGLVQALGPPAIAGARARHRARVGAGDRADPGRRGRPAPRGRGARRRPPGIRRLLGICARPRDLYRAGASVLGRRRADRSDGSLIGIGSLHVQHLRSGRELRRDVNMVVPIDLLPPILDDMLTYGRPNRPPRPWLGLYATEVEDAIVVAGMSERGPASKSGLRPGDRIVAVRDDPVVEPGRLLAQGVGGRPGRQRGRAAGVARRRDLDRCASLPPTAPAS